MSTNGHAKTSWFSRLFRSPDPIQQRLTEAEGRLAAANTKARLAHLERQERQLTENAAIWPSWSWTNDFQDMMTAAGDYIFPLQGWADRTTAGIGHNYPFFQTEQQLAFLRSFSRLVVGQNQFASGMLEGLTAFIVGEGLTYRVTSKNDADDYLVRKVQDLIDTVHDREDWWTIEREAFSRSRRDGEFFLRHFGRGQWRFVEPEQVTQPPGTGREWTYGIHSEPMDVVAVSEYHVIYEHTVQGEIVPAGEIVHLKCNVDANVKRGMPDFSFGTREILESASKLIRNMAEGSALQAAIAEIQQYEQSTQTQAQGFSDSIAEFNRTNQITGKKENIEKVQPGTIRRIPKGTTYVPPPYSQGIQSHIQVFDACLRSAAVRWNAPEWLISSNANNMGAYTSSLVAESPFVKRCKSEQKKYTECFLRCVWMLIQEAIDAGRLPQDTRRMIEVQAEAPRVESRDKTAEAQQNQVYVGLGVKSRQTVAQEQGLDWEQEQVNIEEHGERTGVGPDGSPLPDLPTEAQPEPDQQADAVQGQDLRQTVGGLQAIAGLQASFYSGQIPMPAAIANVRLLFGFSDQEASSLFPNIAPKPLTQEPAAPPSPFPEGLAWMTIPPGVLQLMEALECDQGVNKGKPGPCPGPESGNGGKVDHGVGLEKITDQIDALVKQGKATLSEKSGKDRMLVLANAFQSAKRFPGGGKVQPELLFQMTRYVTDSADVRPEFKEPFKAALTEYIAKADQATREHLKKRWAETPALTIPGAIAHALNEAMG